MKKITLFFILWTLLLAAAPRPAASIEVLNAEAAIEFPEQIIFSVEARSDAEIQTLELEYGLSTKACSPDKNVVVPDGFVPSTYVSEEWVWNMRQNRPLPPSPKIIWWRWHLVDSAGNETYTDIQWVTWLDSKHSWQTVQSGNIFLHWYEGSETYIRQFLTVAEETRTRLQNDLGSWPDQDIQIYIYDSQKAMAESFVMGPDWAIGVTFSWFPNIIIGIPQGEESFGRRTVAHELTHVATDNAVDYHCYANVPLWMKEGLAMSYEGEPDPNDEITLNNAIRSNRLLRVRDMVFEYPDTKEDVGVFYAQSISLVKFLIEDYGVEKVREYLLNLRDGHNYDRAMMTVYGFDTDGLEAEWREAIGLNSNANPTEEPTPTSSIATIHPPNGPMVISTITPTSTPQPTETPILNWIWMPGRTSNFAILICCCGLLLVLAILGGSGYLLIYRHRKISGKRER